MDTTLWLLKMKMKLRDTPSLCSYKVLSIRTDGTQQRFDPLTHQIDWGMKIRKGRTRVSGGVCAC